MVDAVQKRLALIEHLRIAIALASELGDQTTEYIEALGVVGGEEVAAGIRIGIVAVERTLPGESALKIG